MAELTASLDTPSSSRGPGAPPSRISAVGDFIGGLTDLATYAGSQRDKANARQDRIDDRARQDVLDSRQDEAYNRENANRDERNLLDRQMFGIDQGIENNVPESTVQGTAGLIRVRDAVDQGKAPAAAYSLKLEALISKELADHPERASVIMDHMASRGVDHYLFRERRADQAAYESTEADKIAGDKILYDTAVRQGLSVEGDPAATRRAGQDYLLYQHNKQITDDRRKEIKENFDMTEAQRKSANEINDRQSLTAVSDIINQHISPFITSFNSLYSTAGTDISKQKALSEAAPQIISQLETLRSQSSSLIAGMGPAAVAEANALIDRNIKGITGLVTGDLSFFKLSMQNLQAMKTQWGVEDRQALPTLMHMSEIYGPAGVQQIFNGNVPFGKETIEQIKKEVSAYSTATKPEDASMHFYNLSQLLRGETNIKQLSAAEARKQVTSLAVVARDRTIRYAQDGKMSLDEARDYTGAYSNLLLGVNSLEAPTTDLKQIRAASGVVADQWSRMGLRALIDNPNTHEQGLSLNQASRNSALKLLDMAHNQVAGVASDIYVKGSVVYDDRAGKFVTKNDPAAPRSRSAVAQTVDPNLQVKADTMNGLVEHLVATAKDDPAVPKNLTSAELRAFYAHGRIPEREAGSAQSKANRTFFDDVHKLTDDLKTDISGMIKDPAFQSKPSFKSPEDAVARTILGEARGEDDKGQQSVASVILNRHKSSGMSIEDVVTAKDQFEPITNRTTLRDIMSIPESDPRYQRALQNARGVLNGTTPDHTGGASHFYSPTTQNALGRKPPEWDNGTGVDIGKHRFFKLGYHG